MTLPETVCAFHPDRRAGVSCQRCGRPICPDCMRTASVGFHCPECSRQGRQQVHTPRTLAARRDPIVTKALVGVNVVVFVLAGLRGGGLLEPSADVQIDFGLVGYGFTREGFVGVDTGEWYRLVTGGFLHADLIHLGLNMFLLWVLGSALEPALGRLRFGLLYAASLLTGSLGVMLLDPDALTVGASGAVFGLMGAMVVAQRAAGIDIWQSGIGVLVGLNVITTFAIPNISIGGHLGGLAGGLLVGALLIELPRRAAPGSRRTASVAAVVLVVALAAASVVASIWASGQYPSVL
ncbi:rhomboid family intramembrane serine protease [Actinomarinicola tropica]|uniref:Rhomboid family intramembrane serine protease n=1 Tax=Actinomarinicola tropica TaxID=2789776 RepID=A0A5Q2RCK5_9ACTN|nr:rhomboid family intramembrane serine protease [Actinomarinicola tropica]QGG94619.1 rhomboid family intramembrane serine protease [Actinomarinicola tropica]